MNLPKGITQRSDGLYEARIMYHGIRKTIYNRDLNELKTEFEELKYKLTHKQYEEDSKLTVNAFSALYIEKKRFDGVKDSTIESYQQALDNHILSALGKHRLADVSKDDIRSFLQTIDNYADGTKNIIWTVVKGIFDMAFDEGYITNCIVKGMKNPKSKKDNRTNRKQTKKAFTNSEYRTVMHEVETIETCDLMKFAAYTGLRKGELQAVKHTDIDFDNAVLHVQRSMDKHGNVETVKTDAGDRYVPLSAEAIRIVRKQKILSASGYLFCDKQGQPYTANYLSSEIRKLNKLCKKADKDFPQFSLHTFRHTFATKCANKGMIPKVLMGIMGHSSISMTMDYYSHQEVESAIEELRKVEVAF